MRTVEDVIKFLEECKQTHVDAAQWQDQGYEVSEGDTDFHLECVYDYQRAIDVLNNCV